MTKHIFLIYTKETENESNAIFDNHFINSRIKVNSYTLSVEDIIKIAKRSTTDFFYVIKASEYTNLSAFNFSFAPRFNQAEAVHTWQTIPNVSLYNKISVLSNPEEYDDIHKINKLITHETIIPKIYNTGSYDIVFISYDELTADDNYAQLKNRFPYAKRLHGVKGIIDAHISAAEIVETPMFYVVDADAIIEPEFKFDFMSSDTDTVYVWHSRNPINGLIYGYGGVKLFPTAKVLKYNIQGIDFTTSVSKYFKVIPEVSNITKFNVDPFSTWRSGFRECVKLSSNIIENNDNQETKDRLDAWRTKGADMEFGEFAIRGANEGAEYGKANRNQPDMIRLINDYDWLKERFNS